MQVPRERENVRTQHSFSRHERVKRDKTSYEKRGSRKIVVIVISFISFIPIVCHRRKDVAFYAKEVKGKRKSPGEEGEREREKVKKKS